MFLVNQETLIEIFIDCDDFCQIFNPIYQNTLLPVSKKSHNMKWAWFNLTGKVYADKGFISSKITEEFARKGLHLITKIKSNMKNRLITLQDKYLLLKRGDIESVFDIMAAICDIDHSGHRSPANCLYTSLCRNSGLFLPRKTTLYPYKKIIPHLFISFPKLLNVWMKLHRNFIPGFSNFCTSNDKEEWDWENQNSHNSSW